MKQSFTCIRQKKKVVYQYINEVGEQYTDKEKQQSNTILIDWIASYVIQL